MSDAAAATTAAPAKATKKRAGGASKAKKPADHPKYSEMIKAAVAALKVCNFSISLSRVLALIAPPRHAGFPLTWKLRESQAIEEVREFCWRSGQGK